jgi:hypothetical protein
MRSTPTCRSPRWILLLAPFALALGGCSVGVGYTYDEHAHDHHHHQQYFVVGFEAVVVGSSYAPSPSIACLCEQQLDLLLSLENRGPQGNTYSVVDGRSQRFLVYDEWGYRVWDSWRWHHDTGVIEHWELPVGATITLSERWNLVDDYGYALPPGHYTVYASFGGSLAGGELPADPPPLVIEILPDGIG